MKTRSQKLVIAVIVLVVLFLAEVAARAIEPRVSSEGTWPVGEIAAQYDGLREIARKGERVDVLFSGSSMVGAAIDTEEFTKATGERAVNAWLPAASNTTIQLWMLDVVAPMVRAKTVVLGVASRDFNDSAVDNYAYRAFVTSPGYLQHKSDTFLADLDRKVSNTSALARVRRSLRSPVELARSIAANKEKTTLRACQAPKRGTRRNRVQNFQRGDRQVWFRDYETGGAQTEALIRTITELQDRGTEVIVLALPGSPDYEGLHKDEGDVEEFETALETVLSETGVRFIDGRVDMPGSLFRDPFHPTCRGSSLFTRSLSQGWRDLDTRRRIELEFDIR